MNFIQKIPKIFALVPDDKGLCIFFFEIHLSRSRIKKSVQIFL
jgi:hypothetical protein